MSATVYGSGYSGTDHYLAARGRYTASGQRRAMVIHQGYGQSAVSNLPPSMLANSLDEMGSAVLGADFGDGKQFGNDTAQALTSSLWTYAQTTWGAKTDKLLLYGVSMGGAHVLNWAVSNVAKVAAIGLTIPAVDLGDIYDNNRSSSLGFTASTAIDAAYGGPGSFSGTVRSTHNPAVNAAALAGIPIIQFYSANDPVCIPSTQLAFSAASGSRLVSMGNYGHGSPSPPDPVAFQVRDQAVSFLAQYA